jgi:hypothetical protein
VINKTWIWANPISNNVDRLILTRIIITSEIKTRRTKYYYSIGVLVDHTPETYFPSIEEIMAALKFH